MKYEIERKTVPNGESIFNVYINGNRRTQTRKLIDAEEYCEEHASAKKPVEIWEYKPKCLEAK